MTQTGSPDPRNDIVCITSSCPRQLMLPIYLADVCHAAINNFGSLYQSPRTVMAQAIRAILLASATAATLVGRRSINRVSQTARVCPLVCPDGKIAEGEHCVAKCKSPAVASRGATKPTLSKRKQKPAPTPSGHRASV